jgi:hypothetical protein
MTSKKIGSVVVAMLIFVAVPVEAGSINLNDIYNSSNPFMGDNYLWTDVVESNGVPSDPASNYYRDPTAVENSFFLSPTDFRVDVTPGPGSQELDSRLEMVITGIGGAPIPLLSFSESGQFEVMDFNGSGSSVQATVDYTFDVLNGPNAGAGGSGSVTFEAMADDFGLWELTFDIDIPDGATQIRFAFENRVTANAASDLSAAFIAKKRVEGIEIMVVPEPSGALLLLMGLLTVAMRRRS